MSGCTIWFIPLPNDKILDRSKMKDLAENKIYMTQKLNFVLGRLENIVGKGENAGHQHFLLFPQCFQMLCFSGSFKSELCGKELKHYKSICNFLLNYKILDWFKPKAFAEN